MNTSYVSFLESDGAAIDTYEFRDYLLSQDTIIIPDMWELVCSPWVIQKIKEDPEVIKDRFLYRDNDKIYFIYSRYFEWIGDVKLFFDTTPYINSQMIIIKTWIIFIFLVFILQFFWGRYISWRLLKDLKNIASSVKDIDINTNKKRILCKNLPDDDEIRILAEALNTSYQDIEKQTWKLKQFLTDVSHEFKTPLMVMNSKLDVLEKKKDKWSLEEDDIGNFFILSRQNISKLNSLLESLFFVSRIEEQSWCLVKKPVFFYNFIDEKILNISESYSHKKLSYTINADKKLQYDVEENTFWILLDNLISNAMKFSPDDMKISVVADAKGFSISDNGPGIKNAHREKIWEKFYRTDTNKEGFWVWLYLVKRIVNIYNWNIDSVSWSKNEPHLRLI